MTCTCQGDSTGEDIDVDPDCPQHGWTAPRRGSRVTDESLLPVDDPWIEDEYEGDDEDEYLRTGHA